MNTSSIHVEKNFRQVLCGTVKTIVDRHGNNKYEADRVVDGQKVEFWNKGAAEHWLRLGGLLHG